MGGASMGGRMDQKHPPTLRFITGDSAGHMVLVEKERVVLGRNETADVTVADVKTSREHAAITLRDGAWWVEDLKSRNGTLLNGNALVAPALLRSGDRIKIGLIELEFDIVAAPAEGTRLTAVEGPLAPSELPIASTLAVIGRGKGAIDVGADAAASEHAQIRLREGAWRLRSCDAGCPTFLNGDRIVGEVRLKTGDRIRIGASLLEFIDGRIDQLGGQSIDEYTLATRIGAGTLGVVYRARDQKGAPIAMKLLDPALRDDGGAVARFMNGARYQSRIEHPNVVKVLKVSQAGPLPSAAMEWVPNGSLAERLAAGERLNVKQWFAMAKDIAGAMAAAEAQRVYHHGLRPRNILFDAKGAALVSDFAMSAPFDPLHPSEGGDSRWISPEEAGGSAADAQANQFSLGLILYQCITRKAPFGEGDHAAVANARIGGALPSLRSSDAEVPQAFENLLARLLARSRKDRFASWDEARTQIEAALAGKDVPAPPTGSSVLGGKTQSGLHPAARDAKSPSAVLPAANGGKRPSEVAKRPSEVKRPSEATKRPSEVLKAVAAAEPAPSSRPTDRITKSSSTARMPAQTLSRELGMPPSAWAGIFILVAMVVGIVVLSTLKDKATESADAMAAKPAAPKTPALPTRPRPVTVEPAPDTESPDTEPIATAAPAAPRAAVAGIEAAIVVATLVGGIGDQAITEVGFDAKGRAFGAGKSFKVTYAGTSGSIEGDVNTNDAARFDGRPPLPRQVRLVAGGHGRNFTLMTRQPSAVLQQPRLALTGSWIWWDWDAERALADGLSADTRIYDAFALGDRQLVAQCWCAAANTSLVRDPRDFSKPNPGLTAPIDGAASVYLIFDPASGAPVRSLALPVPPAAHATDTLGRVVISTPMPNGAQALSVSGKAGFTVLSADLSGVMASFRIGALDASAAGTEAFAAIAIKDDLVVLGGATSAAAYSGSHAVQARAGGGLDGLFVIVRLTGGTSGVKPANEGSL
jgi:serine/threonine protein kinase